MQKGYLLYVRFNRNWTEVYGPFRNQRDADPAKQRPADKRDVAVAGEAAVWWLAVPVADGVKLL